MNIPKYGLHNVSFTGHTKKLDDRGKEVQQFYYLYDTEKYSKCEVEIYSLDKDENLNYRVGEQPVVTRTMDGGKLTVDMKEREIRRKINTQEGFAYRFKLTDKNGKTEYAFDNGSVVGIFDNNKENKFNIVLKNRGIINKNGPMQLIMPDSFNPKIAPESLRAMFLSPADRSKAKVKSVTTDYVRNHANKLGGNFHGIIERLDQLEAEGISRIVGTPFTKDRVSSHLYWTENAYQTAPNLGSTEDFKTLQKELFKRGINWIADAALVNEGFGGIHMSEFLRKGNSAFSRNMFRIENSIEPVKLGVIPKNSPYTRIRFVNAPFEIVGKKIVSKPYDKSKPTYIQFYDNRLVSDAQLNEDKVFTQYDNKTTGNLYDITKHDDAVYPYAFEVDPDTLKKQVTKLAEKNNGELDLTQQNKILALTQFGHYSIGTKNDVKGLELWDGNVDIAKLNFYMCQDDEKRFSSLPKDEKIAARADFKRGTYAVRDYAINSGKYWTKLTSDTLIEFVSDELSKARAQNAGEYANAISNLINQGKLPKSAEVKEGGIVTPAAVKNVINGTYESRIIDKADMKSDFYEDSIIPSNTYSISDFVLKHAMDVPLETLPFNVNLLGVLTSPYISKKPSTEEEIGISRFDLAKSKIEINPNLPGKYRKVYESADRLYIEQIAPMITQILTQVDGFAIKDENGKINTNEKISKYGRFVANEITPDLTKYIFIKAINPNAQINISEDGQFDFSNIDENDYTIQALGLKFNGESLEKEAQHVINKLSEGISNIPKKEVDELTAKIKNRFADRSLNDYLIAEMLVDRTESGLGWRIDATKDIASINSVRSGIDDMESTWDNVTQFWAQYNSTVREINPHAYTTAEITDLGDLFGKKPEVFGFEYKALRDFYSSNGNDQFEEVRERESSYKVLLPKLFTPPKATIDEEAERIYDKIIEDTSNGEYEQYKEQYPHDSLAIAGGLIDAYEKLYAFESQAKKDIVRAAIKDYVENNKNPKYIDTATMKEAIKHVLDVATENGLSIKNREQMEKDFLKFLLGENTKYDTDSEAERKFIEQTGITSVANYTYFFSLLPELFYTRDFEKGAQKYAATSGDIRELRNKLDAGWGAKYTPAGNPGFFYQSPADGVVNSYTFVGNHDKPRALHCLSLDMEMFNHTFEYTGNEFLQKFDVGSLDKKGPITIKTIETEIERLESENKETKDAEVKAQNEQKIGNLNALSKYARAASVLGTENIGQINSHVAGKAIAMGEKLQSSFATAINELKLDSDVETEINIAIGKIASGSHLGQDFDAEAFGTRPFEIAINSVIEEVLFSSKNAKVKQALNSEVREKLEATTLKTVLEPAMDKYYSIYKLLTVLPGSPTDFAGDKVASSGYETKAKNYHQQNRNFIHWEWLNENNPNYGFVQEFYKNTRGISNLRSIPELSALNDGTTVTLPIEASDDWGSGNGLSPHLTGMLRYNDKDSVVITLHNNYVSEYNKEAGNIVTKTSADKTNSFDKIILCPANGTAKQGLQHGLPFDEKSGQREKFKIVSGVDKNGEAIMSKETYYIHKGKLGANEYYYLASDLKGTPASITIKPEDFNTVIFCKVK